MKRVHTAQALIREHLKLCKCTETLQAYAAEKVGSRWRAAAGCLRRVGQPQPAGRPAAHVVVGDSLSRSVTAPYMNAAIARTLLPACPHQQPAHHHAAQAA
jgi:hypothetical protein